MDNLMTNGAAAPLVAAPEQEPEPTWLHDLLAEVAAGSEPEELAEIVLGSALTTAERKLLLTCPSPPVRTLLAQRGDLSARELSLIYQAALADGDAASRDLVVGHPTAPLTLLRTAEQDPNRTVRCSLLGSGRLARADYYRLAQGGDRTWLEQVLDCATAPIDLLELYKHGDDAALARRAAATLAWQKQLKKQQAKRGPQPDGATEPEPQPGAAPLPPAWAKFAPLTYSKYKSHDSPTNVNRARAELGWVVTAGERQLPQLEWIEEWVREGRPPPVAVGGKHYLMRQSGGETVSVLLTLEGYYYYNHLHDRWQRAQAEYRRKLAEWEQRQQAIATRKQAAQPANPAQLTN